MKSSHKYVFRTAFALIVFLQGERGARAAGFAAAHFGGEHGSVVETNPLSLYYNPAGIGFSDGIHLFLDGEIAIRSASWTHVAPAPGAQDNQNSQYGNSGVARLLNVFGGPALAISGRFGNFALGAGVFAPFAGRVNFGPTQGIPTSSPSPTASCSDPSHPVCPLAANGVARWHLTSATLTFIYAAAGAAWRLGPLSLGVSGNFINSQLIETQSHTLSGFVDSTQEDTASLSVSGNNGSFGAGAMLEIVPQAFYLAASYQAQPGLGPQTLSGSLQYTAGPSPYYAQIGSVHYDVDFHETLPDIWRVGTKWRVSDAVELRASGDFTRWSVFQSQCINLASKGPACAVYGPGGGQKQPLGGDATPQKSTLVFIPRNWNNTYALHVGGSLWVSPEVEIFAGGGYETGASPASTIEPGTMDGNNVDADLGARVRVANRWCFSASYTQLQFFDRNVTTSQLSVANGVPVSATSYQQDGNGLYKQWVGVVDVNAETQF